jgi:hypothetical protein
MAAHSNENMPANWEASSSVRLVVSRISWIALPKS